MKGIIIRLDARTALQCPEFLHKSFAPNCFDLSERVSEDPIVAEYKRLGLVHEERVLDFIRELPIRRADISRNIESVEQQRETARALLDPSIQIILGAYIAEECEVSLREKLGDIKVEDKSRVSRPDILIQVGLSSKGSPLWAPVDIKNHGAFDEENKSNKVKISKWVEHLPENAFEVSGKLKFDDGMQLAHYYVHLSNLGIASPNCLVGVVGRDYESIVWAYLDQTKQGRGAIAPSYLSIYHKNFLEAEHIVKKSIERNQDRDVEAPSISKMKSGKFGCSMCEYRKICLNEMISFDAGAGHVTLLPRVTPSVAEKDFPGIESIRELIAAGGLTDTGEKARRRAKAWESGIPQLVDPAEPLKIPEFDIEIDIDLENSQALLEEILEGDQIGDDRVYLYGYGVHDRLKNSDWRTASFEHFSNFGGTSDDEYEILLAMWQKLNRMAEAAQKNGSSIGIFHYSSHEKTWWRRFVNRFSDRPETPTLDQVENFMNQYFIDLLDYSRKVALKTTGYSIKQLAPLAGFAWSVDDAGGANSLLKYKLATNISASVEDQQNAIRWLIDYNRDDVKATFAVREYLRNLKF